MITALAFALAAPLPLLVHLGRPERALEMIFSPNFTSAMSGFGFVWTFYVILLIVEIWLIFRRDILKYADASRGMKRLVYSLLSLGNHNVSDKTFQNDERMVKILSFIGIPTACILHGYVGFIFGAVKANPWWSTPLMPIIFLLSAMVSGVALLIVLYVIVTSIRKAALDLDCLAVLAKVLFAFLVLDITLKGLELLSMAYESEESWESISQLLTQQISLSFFGIQMGLGAVIPLLILAIISIGLVGLRETVKTRLIFLASVLVLVGVFAMRWNVIIGGQLLSKSFRGFTSYIPPLAGREGILVAVALLALPFIILGVISYIIPPWMESVEQINKIPERRWFEGKITAH